MAISSYKARKYVSLFSFCIKVVSFVSSQWRLFPVAVRQVLKYEPESQLLSRYTGDLEAVKAIQLVRWKRLL